MSQFETIIARLESAPFAEGIVSHSVAFDELTVHASRFVVAVALTDPHNGHFGSLLGGPVFKEVMTFALQKYRVPPSGSTRPVIPTTWK